MNVCLRRPFVDIFFFTFVLFCSQPSSALNNYGRVKIERPVFLIPNKGGVHITISREDFYRNIHYKIEAVRNHMVLLRQDFDRLKQTQNNPQRLNIACFSLEFFDETGHSLGMFYFGHPEERIADRADVMKEPYYFLSGRFDLSSQTQELQKLGVAGSSLPHMGFFYNAQSGAHKDSSLFLHASQLEETFQKHMDCRRDKECTLPISYEAVSDCKNYKGYKVDPAYPLAFCQDETIYTHSEQLALSQMFLKTKNGQTRFSFFLQQCLKKLKPTGKKISVCIFHIYSTYALCRRCAASIIFDFFCNSSAEGGRVFVPLLNTLRDFNNNGVAMPEFRIICGAGKKYYTKIAPKLSEKNWYDTQISQAALEKDFLTEGFSTKNQIHEFLIQPLDIVSGESKKDAK